MEKQDEKINVEDQQESDLHNIKKFGYSDNRIIADENDKGYTMTEFVPESELLF